MSGAVPATIPDPGARLLEAPRGLTSRITAPAVLPVAGSRPRSLSGIEARPSDASSCWLIVEASPWGLSGATLAVPCRSAPHVPRVVTSLQMALQQAVLALLDGSAAVRLLRYGRDRDSRASPRHAHAPAARSLGKSGEPTIHCPPASGRSRPSTSTTRAPWRRPAPSPSGLDTLPAFGDGGD
ncbi:unnamed protein product [Trichogramma brassicae]|uniref:Uncharacterized protein n=1 Tax=Trichogramma brassicae TaxID=86971 RepID=A0A6H5I5S6_9HYME|nr:unnamed protein product [Trichogramma brassicae]